MGEVGKEIRKLRESKGWGQTKLAAAADMAVSGVSQIENGHRNPNSATLIKLAGALGVEVADLFPKTPAPPSQATLFNGEAEEERRIAYLRAWRVFLEDQAREWRADGEEFLREEEPDDAGALAWAVTNRRAVDSIRNKVLREFATGTYPPEDSSEYQELMAVCDAIDRVTDITYEFMRHVVIELHERAKAQQTAADRSKVEDMAKVQESVLRAREEMRERTKAINRELAG